MGEYMLFIYERNQDFRQTLYAVPPPSSKKPHQCVCIYIHVYIPIHAHRIPTRHMHTHVPPALRSRCHAFKQLHVSTLFSSPVMTISTGRILVQLRHEEENALRRYQGSLEGGLFVCLFFSHPGRSSRVQRCRSTKDEPPHPAAGTLQPHGLAPPPRNPCLGVGRQRPAPDNVKKATHAHTRPTTQIIK